MSHAQMTSAKCHLASSIRFFQWKRVCVFSAPNDISQNEMKNLQSANLNAMCHTVTVTITVWIYFWYFEMSFQPKWMVCGVIVGECTARRKSFVSIYVNTHTHQRNVKKKHNNQSTRANSKKKKVKNLKAQIIWSTIQHCHCVRAVCLSLRCCYSSPPIRH